MITISRFFISIAFAGLSVFLLMHGHPWAATFYGLLVAVCFGTGLQEEERMMVARANEIHGRLNALEDLIDDLLEDANDNQPASTAGATPYERN